MVANTKKMVSFEIAEINPILDVHNKTAHFGMELILSAFGKQILYRGNEKETFPSSQRRGILSHDHRTTYTQGYSRDVHAGRRTLPAAGKRQAAMFCLRPPLCHFRRTRRHL